MKLTCASLSCSIINTYIIFQTSKNYILILWNHLNYWGPIFVDFGFFAHSLGYDFVDTSVFSFSKKTNILQICFRRECKFVRQATHDYLKHLATMNSYDSTVVKNLKKPWSSSN